MAAAESYPADLRYHRDHDWIRLDGEEAVFGITWFAQDALGDVVYFEPPSPGDVVRADGPYGELESVKAVSDVIAPLSGEVVAVNELVVNSPELVNADPYGDGWLIRVRLDDLADADALMSADAYKLHLQKG